MDRPHMSDAARMIEDRGGAERFSLLGGPLHRLGRRLGLVRGATNTTTMGVAIGVFLWFVLLALATIERVGHVAFSLALAGTHVRLLLVIPLCFLCESLVDPRMDAFVGTIARSGVVPEKALPALNSVILRTRRWKDSVWPDALCLLAAALWSMSGLHGALPGMSATFDPSHTVAGAGISRSWYWIVCLPLFRFLIMRWMWRLGIWWYFLARVAWLELRLVPTHPDGAGGLGFLEVVHAHFLPLIVAISAVQAASFAEEFVTGEIAFETIYPTLISVVLVNIMLFVGPLLLFSRKLWTCKVDGLMEYMEFAESYVRGFDTKWLRTGPGPTEPLLGTSDLQSLADLGNSVSVVRRMRWAPVSLIAVRDITLAALVPIAPLLLLKYPIAELAQRFVSRLAGL